MFTTHRLNITMFTKHRLNITMFTKHRLNITMFTTHRLNITMFTTYCLDVVNKEYSLFYLFIYYSVNCNFHRCSDNSYGKRINIITNE